MSQINRFWCLPLRSDGTPIPRWQQTQSGGWREGLLRMQEERDNVTARTTIVARLFAPTQATEVRSPLRDAVVVLLADQHMVVRGMERDDLTCRDTAQAWLLVAGANPQGGGTLNTY